MKRLTALGFMLASLSSAGCLFGNSATSPTTYTIVSPVTETFQGTLAVGGSSTYNFIIGNADPLRITLASLANPTTGAAVAVSVRLQLGTTDGTTCTPTFTTTASPALAAQYAQVATPGSYCVVIADPGTLSTPLAFAVRIVHS